MNDLGHQLHDRFFYLLSNVMESETGLSPESDQRLCAKGSIIHDCAKWSDSIELEFLSNLSKKN